MKFLLGSLLMTLSFFAQTAEASSVRQSPCVRIACAAGLTVAQANRLCRGATPAAGRCVAAAQRAGFTLGQTTRVCRAARASTPQCINRLSRRGLPTAQIIRQCR